MQSLAEGQCLTDWSLQIISEFYCDYSERPYFLTLSMGGGGVEQGALNCL